MSMANSYIRNVEGKGRIPQEHGEECYGILVRVSIAVKAPCVCAHACVRACMCVVYRLENKLEYHSEFKAILDIMKPCFVLFF